MELQKVPEGSFNKENINDSVGFIVLNFLFQLLKKNKSFLSLFNWDLFAV